MRALVLGGNGFIGSHLVDELLAKGHRVRVLDRGAERFRAPLRGVEYCVGKFSDPAVLPAALAGVDCVFHLVSTSLPATSNLDPVGDVTGNLIATLDVLAMMRVQRVKRIVYLSSGGTVYGIPETSPIPEAHPLNPICSYGIVKLAIEKYLTLEARLHGLQPVILRASNPYGPRQGNTGLQGVIGTFLWALARDQPMQIWGDGKVVRDFIHVRDLAALCVLAADGRTSGVFNAGSGAGHSIADVAVAINAATGHSAPPEHLPGRAVDVPHAVLDTRAARTAFGWTPEIGLDEGLRETWAWVRAQAREAAA